MNWFNMGDGGLYLVAENDKKIQNNTIRIFAHGYPDGMKGPNGKMIHQPDELLELLEKYSPTWNAFKQKGGSIILDLRVCNIGRSEYSFAHRLSQDPAFKNVVIIGPADYYIASPDGKRAHVGGPGNYNIFLNGKLVRGTYNKKKL
ncbi:hypothetical protein [Chryseobacterium sp. S90]|uniref:hypothetical protein n=1 Tax=Chryseobacterium sp. S90 TaxID=3395373 RepID=UPI0039BD3786